jgi:hypothetical protein
MDTRCTCLWLPRKATGKYVIKSPTPHIADALSKRTAILKLMIRLSLTTASIHMVGTR